MSSAPNRFVLFAVVVVICIGLIGLSVVGILGPFRTIASVPLGLLQQGVGSVSRRMTGLFSNVADLQNLKERNAELEQALVNFQAEIVDLREIKADYDRLSALMNYQNTASDRQYLPANVIGRDTTGLLRSIIIDRGTRDGIALGMPVVTDLGFVGRIYEVTATSAQVQLVTDISSFVNSRLQLTRSLGLIQGTASGGLQMINIPLTDVIKEGDSVVTSGIGGKFPRGLIVGQVTNSQIDDTRLFQKAQVRSLVDFNRLEIVLVITNFVAADPSEFATPTAAPGAPQQ